MQDNWSDEIGGMGFIAAFILGALIIIMFGVGALTIIEGLEGPSQDPWNALTPINGEYWDAESGTWGER